MRARDECFYLHWKVVEWGGTVVQFLRYVVMILLPYVVYVRLIYDYIRVPLNNIKPRLQVAVAVSSLIVLKKKKKTCLQLIVLRQRRGRSECFNSTLEPTASRIYNC